MYIVLLKWTQKFEQWKCSVIFQSFINWLYCKNQQHCSYTSINSEVLISNNVLSELISTLQNFVSSNFWVYGDNVQHLTQHLVIYIHNLTQYIYRRGPVRYRFQGLYELDSLAIVNVRDVGSTKNAFKMLMFPAAKMYQADSAKSKVRILSAHLECSLTFNCQSTM